MLIVPVFVCAGHGRMHAAEQRKERESLEELIHSIQLESELTSRALKQTVSVSFPVCFTQAWTSVHVSVCFTHACTSVHVSVCSSHAWTSVHVSVCCTHAWTSVYVSVRLAVFLYVCMFSCCVIPLLSEARLQSHFACIK